MTSPWNVKDTDAVDVISILRRAEIPRIVPHDLHAVSTCVYYVYIPEAAAIVA